MSEENKEKKSKKINQLKADEVNKKIEEYQASGNTAVKYYKHLVQRKQELGA